MAGLCRVRTGSIRSSGQPDGDVVANLLPCFRINQFRGFAFAKTAGKRARRTLLADMVACSVKFVQCLQYEVPVGIEELYEELAERR